MTTSLPSSLRYQPQPLPPSGHFKNRHHVFQPRDLDAVDAALAACRPLLLRGEPGTGKTQFAEAAAAALGWPLIPFTVDGRTEARDLLYEIDFVLRLAEAQLIGALEGGADRERIEAARSELSLLNFTRPGPLWWAFDWEGADGLPLKKEPDRPEGWEPGQGCVVLIDEIDKAEPDVPNGLLEALGLGHFRDPVGGTVESMGKVAPLILITTNEEREMPDAFLRRCLVHRLALPRDRDKFCARLAACAKAHFPKVGEPIAVQAAGALFDIRDKLPAGAARPGLAEFLDVLRILHSRVDDDSARAALLNRYAPFAFQKFATGSDAVSNEPA